MFNKLAKIAFLTLLVASFLQHAFCDEAASGTEPASENAVENKGTDSDAQSENKSSGTVLQGGVRGSAVRLEEGLGMVEVSAKVLQGSALEIAKEVTRKETAVVRGPNYIGNGIVIPAIGNPNGTMQLGEMPARRDKVDRFIANAEDAVKALRSQIDGLIIPEGSPQELHNIWTGMQSTMKAAETNIGSMRELANQTPANKEEINRKDAKQIGRAALKVYDSMTALDKMRTQILSYFEPNKAKSKD
jgi:hypothetical protein